MRGAALITVLWVLVVLGAAATLLTQTAYFDRLMLAHYEEATAARALAREGIAAALSVLTGEGEVDHLGQAWAQGVAGTSDLGGGTYSVTITDIGSRINLNEADEQLLAALPQITTEQLAALLDWRDRDELTRELGAESGYYLGLPMHYEAKNGLLDSVQELRLIRDLAGKVGSWDGLVTTKLPVNINVVSPDALEALLVGVGVQELVARGVAEELRDYRQEKNELFRDLGEAQQALRSLTSGVLEQAGAYITVEGMINVNTAPRQVLAVLAAAYDVDERLVGELMQARPLDKPALDQLLRANDVAENDLFAAQLGVKSRWFALDSVGETENGARHCIWAEVERLPGEDERNRAQLHVFAWEEGVCP